MTHHNPNPWPGSETPTAQFTEPEQTPDDQFHYVRVPSTVESKLGDLARVLWKLALVGVGVLTLLLIALMGLAFLVGAVRGFSA